jgi:hypothetical protein
MTSKAKIKRTAKELCAKAIERFLMGDVAHPLSSLTQEGFSEVELDAVMDEMQIIQQRLRGQA